MLCATTLGEVEATVRGVLICDGETKMFGCKVDNELLQKWLAELIHPVGLTELYGVLVAFGLCDTWTAIDVFIKGTSQLRMWRQLLLQLEKIDDSVNALVWMARVASQSDVSDPPSRGR